MRRSGFLSRDAGLGGPDLTTFAPSAPAEVLAAVQWAAAEDQPLEILGHGSKRGIGRPPQTEHAIDLSRLTGVTLYEPEELVLSARAGTPLADIVGLIARSNQELAFEPADYGPLLGLEPELGTIGGALACNLSGPRRIKAGAARDHILGVQGVSGWGEAFKAGGRVVKNVTGYDLSKAMAGSWGTLAVLTDVTFKVLPRAEDEITLMLRGLSEERAVEAMAIAMGSSAEVSGAAHLPQVTAGRAFEGAYGDGPLTALRLEGFRASVRHRIEMLKAMFAGMGELDAVGSERSRRLWRDIRDVRPFVGDFRPVWRVSMAPSHACRMVAALRMQVAAEAFYDWQGGLVWIRLDDDPEAHLLRGLIHAHGGGHATLIRAEAPVRAGTTNFQPQPPALAALSRRLKEQFDPKGILNPGRMG